LEHRNDEPVDGKRIHGFFLYRWIFKKADAGLDETMKKVCKSLKEESFLLLKKGRRLRQNFLI